MNLDLAYHKCSANEANGYCGSRDLSRFRFCVLGKFTFRMAGCLSGMLAVTDDNGLDALR